MGLRAFNGRGGKERGEGGGYRTTKGWIIRVKLMSKVAITGNTIEPRSLRDWLVVVIDFVG